MLLFEELNEKSASQARRSAPSYPPSFWSNPENTRPQQLPTSSGLLYLVASSGILVSILSVTHSASQSQTPQSTLISSIFYILPAATFLHHAIATVIFFHQPSGLHSRLHIKALIHLSLLWFILGFAIILFPLGRGFLLGLGASIPFGAHGYLQLTPSASTIAQSILSISEGLLTTWIAGVCTRTQRRTPRFRGDKRRPPLLITHIGTTIASISVTISIIALASTYLPITIVSAATLIHRLVVLPRSCPRSALKELAHNPTRAIPTYLYSTKHLAILLLQILIWIGTTTYLLCLDIPRTYPGLVTLSILQVVLFLVSFHVLTEAEFEMGLIEGRPLLRLPEFQHHVLAFPPPAYRPSAVSV